MLSRRWTSATASMSDLSSSLPLKAASRRRRAVAGRRGGRRVDRRRRAGGQQARRCNCSRAASGCGADASDFGGVGCRHRHQARGERPILVATRACDWMRSGEGNHGLTRAVYGQSATGIEADPRAARTLDPPDGRPRTGAHPESAPRICANSLIVKGIPSAAVRRRTNELHFRPRRAVVRPYVACAQALEIQAEMIARRDDFALAWISHIEQ